MSEWEGLEGLSFDGVELRKPVAGAGKHIMTIKNMVIETKGVDKQMVVEMENDANVCKDWLVVHCGNYNDPEAKDKAIKRKNRGLSRLMRIQQILGDETPDKAKGIDFFVGKKVGVNIYEQEYMGKQQTKIGSFFHPDDIASQKSAPAKGSGSTTVDMPDDEIPF